MKNIRNIFISFLWIVLTVETVNAQQLPGMYVSDRFLFSETGDTVILKGFNAMIVYWDIHGEVNFPEIEKTGANCVRIFWKLDFPTPQPSDLDKVLGNCIKHHMIPIICLWDATGDWSRIQFCVDYWCSEEIVPILQKYEDHLIVNIANEAGSEAMGNTEFRNTYSAAVQQMRDAGIHIPLMIDADRWGRNADAVLDNGEYLLEQDPDHNLLFSWHLWDPSHWGSGTVAEIDRIINKAAETDICFVVGEFGPCEQCDNCSGTPINWEYLIEKAYKNNIGYIPWVWKWSDCHAIVENNTGAYGSWVNSPWGESVALTSPYSISKTAKRPSGLVDAGGEITEQNKLIVAKPNPFSDAVELSMNLAIASDVDFELFGLDGKKITSFNEKTDPSGNLVIKWSWASGSDIPGNSVYIYKLKIENREKIFFRTGKLVRY